MLGDNRLTVEEYKNCKQQIIEDIKWMDQLEVYTVGAVAAVYVFVFSQAKPALAVLLCFIPLFIALAGALRTLALDETIRVLNDYIVEVEKKNPEIGFTTFLSTASIVCHEGVSICRLECPIESDVWISISCHLAGRFLDRCDNQMTSKGLARGG